MSRTIAAFAASGALWVATGLVATVDPRYWDPVTAIDHAAVGLYSLALLATGLALFLIGARRAGGLAIGRRAVFWIACIGAAVAGVANFFEDWLGLSALGWAYVIGVVAYYLGLMVAGLVLVAGRDTRWIGALFLVPFPALLLGPVLGGIVGGCSFIACAALLAREDDSGRVAAS